jgi:hypothetical protein
LVRTYIESDVVLQELYTLQQKLLNKDRLFGQVYSNIKLVSYNKSEEMILEEVNKAMQKEIIATNERMQDLINELPELKSKAQMLLS